MLHFWRHPQTGELRLYIREAAAEAWISPGVPRDYRGPGDWVLCVRRRNAFTCARCQQALELESRLRAWLLRRYRRRLYDLTFSDLYDVARQERGRATRDAIRRRIRA